jgi:hypothetical protein
MRAVIPEVFLSPKEIFHKVYSPNSRMTIVPFPIDLMLMDNSNKVQIKLKAPSESGARISLSCFRLFFKWNNHLVPY